jgi:type II secretory pathway pseudopilin PulG
VTARDRIVLAVVAVVAALAGAWMLVITPKRNEAKSLTAQVQSVQGQLTTAQGQVATGLAARAKFSTDYAQLASLGQALPQDDEVPSLIYEIQSAANASRVSFHSLQMNPTSGSGTAASSGAAALPPGAGPGTAGLPVEQFSFEFDGNFFHLSNFFQRLQSFVVAGKTTIRVSGRLLTMNAISFGPGPKGFPQIDATVSATTYMAPASGGLTAGATPLGPAGSTPSTTASSGTAAAAITPPNPS